MKLAGLGIDVDAMRRSFFDVAVLGTIVPLCCELVNDAVTPVGLYVNFVGERNGFLLESVEDGQRFGRFSFVGRSPLGERETTAGSSEVTGVLDGFGNLDSFESVRAFLGSVKVAQPIGRVSVDIPLRSGLVNVFGWDSVRNIENIGPRGTSGPQHPDSITFVIGELVAFDHWRQSATLITNVVIDSSDLEEQFQAAVGGLESMVDDFANFPSIAPQQTKLPSEFPLPSVTRAVSREDFCQQVVTAKELIEAGDIFQVVLSQRFDLGHIENPFAVYRVLRQMNPSAYLYYLKSSSVTIVGSSPEALVRLRDGAVTTRPIAGSRPVVASSRANAVSAVQLREDPKEVAEHIMLVDLGRNDLGRVCVFGTVSVDRLMDVEMYSHIMHLTSEVSGDVRPDADPIDVVKATFPAGTLSGAPKVRAMQIINEMEVESRGLYGGSIGYFDFNGNLDTAILIRTLVVDGNKNGSVQTGAGIVWDSDPQAEDDECLAKASAVMRAVGGARQ